MAPFKLGKDNIFHIQSTLLLALIPIIIWGVFVFGTKVLTALAASLIVSFVCEIIFLYLSKNKNLFSPIRPVISGTLSCLILPIAAPLWAFALGAFIASMISFISFTEKSSCTLINPISACGIILFGIFEKAVNNYTAPFDKFSAFQFSAKESIYITTLLQSLKNGTDSITNSTLINTFLGRDSGSIGEVSAILILLGGIFMIYKKYISWHIPSAILSTVFLISFFFPTGNCEAIYCAAVETLSGSVFLYSFFIAPLPSSAPVTKSGKIFFGVFIGIIIMILRRFTSVSDGTMFAVGVMSCFVRMIDKFSGNKYFSYLLTSKNTEVKKKTDLEALLNGNNNNES